MAANERQQRWIQVLDKKENNKILVRYVLSQDFKEIEEFAVIYLTEIDSKTLEVIRFDCSRKEAINVHKFFCKQETKQYLDNKKDFDTISAFIRDIERNWIIYLARFLEK